MRSAEEKENLKVFLMFFTPMDAPIIISAIGKAIFDSITIPLTMNFGIGMPCQMTIRPRKVATITGVFIIDSIDLARFFSWWDDQDRIAIAKELLSSIISPIRMLPWFNPFSPRR